MKRTPEFVLGLIGSIWATVIAIIAFGLSSFASETYGASGSFMGAAFVGLILSIIAIVFSCLVNSKTKASGIILIVCAVLIFITNFFQFVPVILLLIAGIMCLARKLPVVEA